MKRIENAVLLAMLTLGCGSQSETVHDRPQPPDPPTERDHAPETPQTPAPPPRPDGLSLEGGSCLGAAALRCAPSLTCMGRGTGGTCRRPPTGVRCGNAQCTEDEFCCSEAHSRCQLTGTDCHDWLPTETGGPGTRCGGAAGGVCMPGMQCVTHLDLVGGNRADSEGNCQIPGHEGTSCNPDQAESCRDGFVCATTPSGGRCRIPGAEGTGLLR